MYFILIILIFTETRSEAEWNLISLYQKIFEECLKINEGTIVCPRASNNMTRWREWTWCTLSRVACKNTNHWIYSIFLTGKYLEYVLGMMRISRGCQRGSHSVAWCCELIWCITEGWLAKTWPNGFNEWFLTKKKNLEMS